MGFFDAILQHLNRFYNIPQCCDVFGCMVQDFLPEWNRMIRCDCDESEGWSTTVTKLVVVKCFVLCLKLATRTYRTNLQVLVQLLKLV